MNRKGERMKTYISDTCLRIVGKSWEVRAKMRELAKTGLTVQQFLERHKKITSKKATGKPMLRHRSLENILHLHQ